MAMIDRPLVAVAPWFCSLSAVSEGGHVVADVVLRTLGSSSCSTCGAFCESPAPQYEIYKPNSISLVCEVFNGLSVESKTAVVGISLDCS